MTYSTSAVSPLPLKLSTSDATYGVQLQIEFRSFNEEILPNPIQQHLYIKTFVTVLTKESATALVTELRLAADSIEAYIPNIERD